MRFNDTLHPYDPYSGQQLSFIRYSGYRAHQFHMNELERKAVIRKVTNVSKFVGGVIFAAAGFVVLNLLG